MNAQNADKIKLAVLEHHEQLVAYLAGKTRNIETAREVAQDTYEKLLKMNNFDSITNLKAYLFQMASNLAIDRARRRTMFNNYVATERVSDDTSGPPAEVSTERVIMIHERLELLQRVVDALPDKCRRAFLMHRLQNFTYPEIARELSVSVSMVEKYIMQALKACHALKRELDES